MGDLPVRHLACTLRNSPISQDDVLEGSRTQLCPVLQHCGQGGAAGAEGGSAGAGSQAKASTTKLGTTTSFASHYSSSGLYSSFPCTSCKLLPPSGRACFRIFREENHHKGN